MYVTALIVAALVLYNVDLCIGLLYLLGTNISCKMGWKKHHLRESYVREEEQHTRGDPNWMGLVLDETPMLFLSNIVFKTPQLHESVRFILNFYVT